MRSIVLTICAAAALAGCARPPLPVAQSVCFAVEQETPQETAYVRRKGEEFLREYFFTPMKPGEPCDINITYEAFGKFQAETIRAGVFSVQRDGYWSQEGIVTATHNGQPVVRDQSVNLRGYPTKQNLLDDLAWQIVRVAPDYFQAANTPPKPVRK